MAVSHNYFTIPGYERLVFFFFPMYFEYHNPRVDRRAEGAIGRKAADKRGGRWPGTTSPTRRSKAPSRSQRRPL